MLAASVFILIVTLVASTALGWILGCVAIVWDIGNQLIAFAVFTTMFTALFRSLPDRRIPRAQKLRGGVITSALVSAGEFLPASTCPTASPSGRTARAAHSSGCCSGCTALPQFSISAQNSSASSSASTT